jgi:hypothetical protein
MSTKSLHTFTLISLINFLLAAAMGLLLRYAFISEIPFNFNYLLHAHSHVAALGWAYQMICVFLVFYFVMEDSRLFKKLFWVTQISVFGMMLSFPFQGYGSVSIPFSTLHIICSYIFIFYIWKNAQYNSNSEKIILRAALIFLAISTLGIWMLGPSIVLYGKHSILYQISIQFYLHFQFSGWFIFAMVALLIRYFSKKVNIELSPKTVQRVVIFLIASVPLSFALVPFWFFKNDVWIVLNMLTVITQLLLIIFILSRLKGIISFFRQQNKTIRLLFILGFLSLILKVIFQTFTAIPEIALLSHQVRNFSVGYIHLIMLGFVSSVLLVYIFDILKIKLNLAAKFGVWLFIAGFVLSELMLFIQGILFSSGLGQLNYYHEFLFVVSIFLFLAVALITYGVMSVQPKNQI